jgi:hypothetical protein
MAKTTEFGKMTQFSEFGARQRSYKLVLDYLLQFGMTKLVENEDSEYPRTTGGLVGFSLGSFSKSAVKPGDLVLLTSAHADKWRLSWLVEMLPNEIYRCESLIDGELADWSNVGISYFHRPTVEQHPNWKWTDAQHEFSDRWFEAARKCDEYMWRPCLPDFQEDGSVVVGVRMRHGMGDSPRPTITLHRWKALTERMLINRFRALEKTAEEQWKAHCEARKNV